MYASVCRGWIWNLLCVHSHIYSMHFYLLLYYTKRTVTKKNEHRQIVLFYYFHLAVTLFGWSILFGGCLLCYSCRIYYERAEQKHRIAQKETNILYTPWLLMTTTNNEHAFRQKHIRIHSRMLAVEDFRLSGCARNSPIKWILPDNVMDAKLREYLVLRELRQDICRLFSHPLKH